MLQSETLQGAVGRHVATDGVGQRHGVFPQGVGKAEERSAYSGGLVQHVVSDQALVNFKLAVQACVQTAYRRQCLALQPVWLLSLIHI